MRTVIAVLGVLLCVSCAVLILAGWRNPSSRFLVGFVQTRAASSKDPRRTAAAACWLILGFVTGSVGLLVERDASQVGPAGWACAAVFAACVAVAAWVRFGDAPDALRPAAMRASLPGQRG